MASWAHEQPEKDSNAHEHACLSCGARLRETLDRLGSLRCLDCREEDKPLDPELVLAWQTRGAPLS
jgi:hypothetical protein